MINRNLGVRNKMLIAFLSIGLFAIVGTAFFSFRATVKPMRNSAIINMESILDLFYIFLEENPDIDMSVVKKLCNEKIKVGKTGFIFVTDPEGNLLIHKKAEGENWANKSHIKKITERKNGVLRYFSPITKTYKLATFRFFEKRDWIVVAGAFEEDFLSEPTSQIIKYSVIAGIIIIILAGIVIFLFSVHMTRPMYKIIARINDNADQVAAASGQISSASRSLAEGASEQASSLEETSSSLEEMASMTRQNADNATQADNLMKEANKTVEHANTSMEKLTISMKDISEASEETQKIVKTIDEIAFQTNLLALNAAVEAARAGEAGAGFAVVADEVRNLAMRAADAAKNTSGMIEGTVKKIKDGSDLVTTTNEAFTEVATSASKVGELVGEIAAASNEQAQGIEQVNKAVAEMDKVTQQNAANAEESAGASEEMRGQAEQMKGVIAELLVLVSGNSAISDSGGQEEERLPAVTTMHEG